MSDDAHLNRKTPEPDSTSNSSNHSNHDVGLQRLKSERDKITYGGKYMDRYKDEFTRKPPPPPPRRSLGLSARYRDIHGNVLKAFLGNQSSLDETKTPPDLETPNPKSPNMEETPQSPMSMRNVKLKEILSSPVSESRKVIINSPVGSPIMTSKKNNATHELNKADNMSQLTSYKLVPDTKIIFRQSKSHDGSPKVDKKSKKKDDVNIYTIQPSQPLSPETKKRFQKPTLELNLKFASNNNNNCQLPQGDTLNSLQHVQNYISMCEAEAVRKQNLERFDEMLKNKDKKVTSNNNKDEKEKKKEKSQDFDTNHIQEPLKSYLEVEDLLKPGVSDMQAENVVQTAFERGNKTRSSTTGVQLKDAKPNVLSRAVSDAQDRTQLQRKKTVKIRNKNQDLKGVTIFEYQTR